MNGASTTFEHDGDVLRLERCAGAVSVRQQPTAISVANGAGSSLLAMNYGYCLSGDCTKNNGNVQAAGIAVTGMLSVTQNFAYEKLNRLTCADEITGASSGNCGSDNVAGVDAELQLRPVGKPGSERGLYSELLCDADGLAQYYEAAGRDYFAPVTCQ